MTSSILISGGDNGVKIDSDFHAVEVTWVRCGWSVSETELKTDDEITSLVEEEARRALPSQMIVRVQVDRDRDNDDDPILWVKVVVKREFMSLDPHRTIPFGPALRMKLWDIGEKAAPVLRYVVEDEDREFGAAAA